jgi:tRNA A37 threonylcarbamoyladenosine biosynthesis protein TsaE
MVFKKEITLQLWVVEWPLIMKKRKLEKDCQIHLEVYNKSTKITACRSRKKRKLQITKASR